MSQFGKFCILKKNENGQKSVTCNMQKQDFALNSTDCFVRKIVKNVRSCHDRPEPKVTPSQFYFVQSEP